MKIVSILGARPQFIKAAVISRQIAEHKEIEEVIVHTGQHFDRNMSDFFFRDLMLPKPKFYLDVNRLNREEMISQMRKKIEDVLIKERPDIVLVYGDTNTTLAGAQAAKKLNIKLAHIESGLRSFNMNMPEEINRKETDKISDILFCPTERAVNNLKKEAFDSSNCRIIKTGDVMKDTALLFGHISRRPRFNLPKEFILVTIHRTENTDNVSRLKSIFEACNEISKKINIILPIHPRTKVAIRENSISADFAVVDPVGYLEMIYLIKNCKLVMTDSGGLQKESFFFKKPCVILRDETEWGELIDNKFAVLAGTNSRSIYNCYKKIINKRLDFNVELYGNGNASEIIVKEIMR